MSKQKQSKVFHENDAKARFDTFKDLNSLTTSLGVEIIGEFVTLYLMDPVISFVFSFG